jgi:isoleucyl-tRNA synthetase
VKLPAASGGALHVDPDVAAALSREISDELNVRAVEVLSDESDMVERSLFPLLPVIGPRRGTAVAPVMAGARSGEWRLLEDGRVAVGGVELEPDEFQLTARARPGHEVAEEGDLLVALDTALTEELEAEGLAREVAHRLQNLRKAAGLEISDRVVAWIGGDAQLTARLAPHRQWLADEILATELHLGAEEADGAAAKDALDDVGRRLELALRRA